MKIECDKVEACRRIKQWLLALERNQGLTDIDPDSDIINNGIIDSLEFISFLLLIEELRGDAIPADEIQLESFRTLHAIWTNFFSQGAQDE